MNFVNCKETSCIFDGAIVCELVVYDFYLNEEPVLPLIVNASQDKYYNQIIEIYTDLENIDRYSLYVPRYNPSSSNYVPKYSYYPNLYYLKTFFETCNSIHDTKKEEYISVKRIIAETNDGFYSLSELKDDHINAIIFDVGDEKLIFRYDGRYLYQCQVLDKKIKLDEYLWSSPIQYSLNDEIYNQYKKDINNLIKDTIKSYIEAKYPKYINKYYEIKQLGNFKIVLFKENPNFCSKEFFEYLSSNKNNANNIETMDTFIQTGYGTIINNSQQSIFLVGLDKLDINKIFNNEIYTGFLQKDYMSLNYLSNRVSDIEMILSYEDSLRLSQNYESFDKIFYKSKIKEFNEINSFLDIAQEYIDCISKNNCGILFGEYRFNKDFELNNLNDKINRTKLKTFYYKEVYSTNLSRIEAEESIRLANDSISIGKISLFVGF
ncbi:MAG: hypothetical protein GYA60_02735, partial [Candidatus Methanofastidiosa archaeon]|nr:hypothetical protein [Candidatus Methanofastidiosa archaeon]